MAITLPELVAQLEKAPRSAQVAVFADRDIVPIEEVVCVPGSPYVFLCTKARTRMRTAFTHSENGLIGYCAENGIPDETVAKLLGRTEESISRQRKKIGL